MLNISSAVSFNKRVPLKAMDQEIPSFLILSLFKRASTNGDGVEPLTLSLKAKDYIRQKAGPIVSLYLPTYQENDTPLSKQPCHQQTITIASGRDI